MHDEYEWLFPLQRHHEIPEILCIRHYKGPFIFYEVGGAGGIWEGHPKKTALKGGPSKKIKGKGGLT